MENEFIHLIWKMGGRGSLLLFWHIILAWFCLMEQAIYKLLSELWVIKTVSYIPEHFLPPPLPLCLNPPYSTHTFLLQTTQQLTEGLDRMLNKPDISLITSQNTLRSLWLMMLSESWPLPSPMLLSSMYEEEKVFYFFL